MNGGVIDGAIAGHKEKMRGRGPIQGCKAMFGVVKSSINAEKIDYHIGRESFL